MVLKRSAFYFSVYPRILENKTCVYLSKAAKLSQDQVKADHRRAVFIGFLFAHHFPAPASSARHQGQNSGPFVMVTTDKRQR